MDFVPPDFISYVFPATIVSYLLIGLINNNLLLIGKRRGVMCFKGKEAVMAAFAIIIVFSPTLFIIERFDLFTFFLSFSLGLPLAFLAYKFITTYSKIIISDDSESKNSIRNFIIWSIFGLIIASVFAFFISMLYATIFKATLPFDPLLLLIIPLVFGYLFFAIAISARPVYYKKYIYIGASKKEEEENIKIILNHNNINYIIEPFSHNNNRNTGQENQIIKVLVNEIQSYKAIKLLGNKIDTSSILKYY